MVISAVAAVSHLVLFGLNRTKVSSDERHARLVHLVRNRRESDEQVRGLFWCCLRPIALVGFGCAWPLGERTSRGLRATLESATLSLVHGVRGLVPLALPDITHDP